MADDGPAGQEGAAAIRWAPRVSRSAIRRLYHSDAQGLLDDDLAEEVAFAMLARCQSVLTVTAAEHGKVACPRCGWLIRRRGGGKSKLLCCRECGWQATWGEYLASYQHRQLSGGSAVGAFAEYVRRFPATRSARERLLLVDWLIHQVHRSALSGEELPWWRAAAVNLIEGRLWEVVALLEELATGAAGSPELRSTAAYWRANTLPHLHSRPEGGPEPTEPGPG